MKRCKKLSRLEHRSYNSEKAFQAALRLSKTKKGSQLATFTDKSTKKSFTK